MNPKERVCLLEGCNRKARRKFCCNKHKDKYHNRHNPRGRYAHSEGCEPFSNEEYFQGYGFGEKD